MCAGDLVGYGPFPNECARRVASLGGLCVAGNHDLMALGRLGDERCVAVARTTIRWTRTVLDADVRELLAGLPLDARRDGIAVHHGAIGDPTRYVLDRGAGPALPGGAAAPPSRAPACSSSATRTIRWPSRCGAACCCATLREPSRWPTTSRSC